LLNAVSVRDLVEATDGEVLCCRDRLDELAEHILIGAMNPEMALRYFQRTPNKVVITGGDRADIHLAALQTSTRCLVTTGGLYPSERLLVVAEERRVPVVLVSMDTSRAARICEDVRANMSLHSPKKIKRVVDLVNANVDWPATRRELGIG
jgi:hypothetical protein